MELNFDIRGNLKPYDVIEISMDTFKNTFVDAFYDAPIRQELFDNYNLYMNDLSGFLTKDFFQWIDGSYVTNKKEPNDFDLITVLDYFDYEKNKEILEKQFASFNGRQKYKVDAYIVANYPESHKNHIFTKSDFLYWRNLFGKTRVNRAKKQYEKGIIQLNFKKNGQ